ncbi:MAG: histidine kinase dimerization/phospho-acceptor domain-containing protein [Chloroflexota bacterium]
MTDPDHRLDPDDDPGHGRPESAGAGDEEAGAIARAVHDLRNPLTALTGQAQLLRRRIARDGEASPERVLASLDAIEEAAGRMAALLDRMAAGPEGRAISVRSRPASVPPEAEPGAGNRAR